jgi:Zn-dependent protease
MIETKFNKQEIKHIILAIFVIGFAFAFDDNQQKFVLSYWIKNFIIILILVSIAFFVKILTQKYIAKRIGCYSEIQPWKLERYGMRAEAHFPVKFSIGITTFTVKYVPLGFIVPLLITLLSNGQLFFVTTSALFITTSPVYRLGREYKHITNYETAKVAASGPFICILLALIFKLINFNNNPLINEFILINSWMALSNILPIPHFDGAETYFGSKPLFILTIAFILSSFVFLNFLSVFLTFTLAAVIALLSGLLYLYRVSK